MHLSKVYSSFCGVEVNKPYIYDLFYPIVEDKFITIDSNNSSGNSYHHWQDVVDFLIPYLRKEKISIFQIGDEKDKKILHVNRTNEGLSNTQYPFIIKKSLIHITSDGFSAQISTANDVPTVILKEEDINDYPWGDSKNQVIITPPKEECKDANLINAIQPEKIAKAILTFLNIDHEINYETVYMGEKYVDGIEFVESVPDSVVSLKTLQIPSVICRMDLHFNEQNLLGQLQQGKAIVVTDQPIDLRILKQFKQNINELIYVVKETNHPEFCEGARDIGINLILVSYLDEESITEHKLKYMDMGNILRQNCYSFKDVPRHEDLDIDKLYFKSKKYTLSKGNIYQSEYSWKNNIPTKNKSEIQKAHDSALFWKSLELFTILKKTD